MRTQPGISPKIVDGRLNSFSPPFEASPPPNVRRFLYDSESFEIDAIFEMPQKVQPKSSQQTKSFHQCYGRRKGL